MKSYLVKLTAIIFLVLGLVACESEKSAVLTSSSADGAITIEVQGTRLTSLDPFMVEIKAKYNGKEVVAQIEMQADEINADNVTFNWANSRYCVVELTQRDGEVNAVPIRF